MISREDPDGDGVDDPSPDPQVNTDTRGVGLLKLMWKVVEETRASSCLHNVLHVFYAGRGTGTVILEIKLPQYLAIMYQYPLLLVFLDL